MRKIRIFAMAAAIAAGLASTAAFAGCAADIKDIEVRTGNIDTHVGDIIDSLERLTGKAKQALAEGKKKKCAKLVKKARDLLAKTVY